MKWDDTLNSIVCELSKEFDIEEKEIKYAIDNLFRNVKSKLGDPSVPKVMLHSLGTFQTDAIRLQYLEDRVNARFNGGYINEKELSDKIEQICDIRNRLISEKPYLKIHKKILNNEYPKKNKNA